MTEQDPDEGLQVGEMRIRYTLQPDGSDLLTMEVENDLPLVQMLGLLEMAKDCAYELAGGGEDAEENAEEDG